VKEILALPNHSIADNLSSRDAELCKTSLGRTETMLRLARFAGPLGCRPMLGRTPSEGYQGLWARLREPLTGMRHAIN
jgi:hypothetical protein